MKKIFIWAVLICNGIFTLDLINPINKNYFDIILDRVECVIESPETGLWHLKVRKVNKIRAIFGYIEIMHPVGNEISVEAKVLKKQGGEYRYLPFRIHKQPFCKFCEDDTYIYKSFSKNSTLPKNIDKECPLQPGNYTFYGANIDSNDIPNTVMQSGDYAFEWIYSKNEKVFGTYRIYAYVNNV